LRLAANDAPQIIDLAGIFELSQQPIDAAQWRAPPAQPVADVADAVASSAITQTDGAAPLGNAVAPSVAGAKTMDPVVAQQDWPTVARRVKAKVVDQTEALKALGFPAGDGSNYLQARMCLQAALDHLEPTPTLLTDILTQPLQTAGRHLAFREHRYHCSRSVPSLNPLLPSSTAISCLRSAARTSSRGGARNAIAQWHAAQVAAVDHAG
jgi:hypothetical protein